MQSFKIQVSLETCSLRSMVLMQGFSEMSLEVLQKYLAELSSFQKVYLATVILPSFRSGDRKRSIEFVASSPEIEN